MSDIELFELARQASAIPNLLRELEGRAFLRLNSVDAAAKPFLVALLAQVCARPIMIVTADSKRHDQFLDELEVYGRCAERGFQTLSFPESDALPHEDVLPSLDVVTNRLRTLRMLLAEVGADGEARVTVADALRPVVVTTVQALMQKTFAPDALKSLALELGVGGRLDPRAFAERLEKLGYDAEYRVAGKGQFAQRGGIVDYWSPEAAAPTRVEFFGEEIESLRAFDPATQQSQQKLDRAVVLPAGEIGLLKRGIAETESENMAASFSLCEGGLELDEGSLKPATTESLGSLLDYLAANALVVLDENADLDSAAAAYERRVPKDGPFYISWAEIRSRLTEQHITTIELTESPDIDAEHSDTPSLQHVTVGIDSLDAFCRIFARPPSPEIAMQARKEIFSQIKRWCERGYNVFAFCPTDGELDRFKELLAEFHIAALLRGPLIPVLGSISRGFVWDEVRLAVVSDTEIFCRSRLHRPRRTRIEQARSASVPVADFTELEEGDFVVHVQHGIGRYRGLQKITVAGQAQEALTVEYADEAKLYVPIDQAHLVSKYISAGRRIPELSTLGGRRWSKQKADAERAVLDLAAEMLEIQAARQSGKGFAFPADTSWQREFEASFIYEETPDQFRAIEDVKRDLESPQPMDRLICGDVGYGKTEVAIRAAFKAVMANKQVAILVPTTVLAEQHWNTFRDRMSGYPISVEMLSRFRSRAEQRAVVRGLAEGGVDIVIGTHRLLQGDIHFKDLGLVVIDEEQRFGVLHKEKFKRLRRLVEVLTLTATPIPRTLYLALTGARDMSQIETPPQDRLPVKTFVLQYDERTVTDAIRRELARGGQVYYLHNRVQSIEAVAQRVLQLVPDARIAIGHGQMHEDDLEDVMRQFVDGDIDVLVCTTIVESGLDIPNANTIIIDRADRFGLSDLYQLRGRVGRYKHQAYAYILLPRHMHLIETARKRIAAIKQYSSLGSGFKIAMRDLEIRGAGNILGPQQSGHIAAVGFDLYCQLLRESIARLKGEPVKKLPHVELQLDFLDLAVERVAADDGRSRARRKRRTWVEAVERRDLAPCYIPYDYISETPLRIEVYRKLAQAVSEEELKALRNELRDRFGTVPAPVNLLLEVATLRIAAAEAGIDLVESEDDKLKLSQRGMYYQREGRFPRLSAKTGKARLNEIKKLLKSLKTDAQ